jgi:hypothetical protein
VAGGVRQGAGAVSGAVSSTKELLGYGSGGGLHLTGHYSISRSGDTFNHILDISFGLQSRLSINVQGVRVVYASTNNLVTVMLLPEPKVLL